MSHGIHEGPRRVFGDTCTECIARAAKGLDGLSALDHPNLIALAKLAQDKRLYEAEEGEKLLRPQDIGASYADMRAVETLRLAARIVFSSGIDLEDAI